MKKVGYLLLLTPTLFLASCQTTPKIDTILPEEAIKIINKFEKDDSKFIAPNNTSKARWNINKGDETAKGDIKKYISEGYDFSDGKKETYITDDARLNRYITELQDTEPSNFNDVGHDAFVRMNDDLYKKLCDSIPSLNRATYSLKYKKNGGGLTIIEESTVYSTIYIRTHYYNESGREDKFELNVNKESGNLVYTMTIDFRYN